MSKEQQSVHMQFQLDQKKQQPLHVGPAREGKVDSAKKKQQAKPSDQHNRPDQISDDHALELLQAELAIADGLIERAFLIPQVREEFESFSSKYPRNGRHMHSVGRIAAYLAVHFQLSEEEQEIAAIAGLLHDLGKQDEEDVDWEEVSWTPEQRLLWKEAVRNHPDHSAKRVRGIGLAYEAPVALHHAFQPREPYPEVAKYLQNNPGTNLGLCRLVGLADQTEAISTRMRPRATKEEVAALLASHTYEQAVGEPIGAYSQDENKYATVIVC